MGRSSPQSVGAIVAAIVATIAPVYTLQAIVAATIACSVYTV